MKYAIIENGRVSNVAVADAPLADNWIASDAAAIGDTYENGVFSKYDPKADPIATEAKADAVRAERNTMLSASDWTQVADAPVDKAVWAVYRQALRDVSAQAGFPWDVQWPAKP